MRFTYCSQYFASVMMGNNADAVAGTSDEAKLIEELVKLKLTDPQMTNKELADKLEIPLKNCRQLIKKLRNSGKLEEAEQGSVKSSDKKTTDPVSMSKRGNNIKTSLIPELLKVGVGDVHFS